MSPKDIRKQVRNVAQEALTDLLKEELFKNVFAQLQKQIHERLDAIDQRQRAFQDLMLRRSMTETPKVDEKK